MEEAKVKKGTIVWDGQNGWSGREIPYSRFSGPKIACKGLKQGISLS